MPSARETGDVGTTLLGYEVVLSYESTLPSPLNVTSNRPR